MTKPPESHDLEKAMPFLLARAGVRVGTAFSRVLKPYGVSLTEWRACASLLHTPGQTLSELAAHAATDLSALSRVVDRLSERRLVTRKRSTNDKRSIVIALSAKGVALTRTIVPLAQSYETIMLTDFDATECRVLRDMLQRLYRNAPTTL